MDEQTQDVSATALPKLCRESRAAVTREKTARRKPWAPPSKLDAPPAPDGYKHRWIRAMIPDIFLIMKSPSPYSAKLTNLIRIVPSEVARYGAILHRLNDWCQTS